MPTLQIKDEGPRDKRWKAHGGIGGWKHMSQILAPLQALKLTDSFYGWRGRILKFKKKYIIEWAPLILGEILPPDLAQKAYQQMREMEGRKLLHIMSRDSCV